MAVCPPDPFVGGIVVGEWWGGLGGARREGAMFWCAGGLEAPMNHMAGYSTKTSSTFFVTTRRRFFSNIMYSSGDLKLKKSQESSKYIGC